MPKLNFCVTFCIEVPTRLLISCVEVLIYGKGVITAVDIVATFFSRYVNIVLSSKHVIPGSVYQVDP